jgi:ribonucleoside-diphosphate reductase alpha chain
MIPDEKHDRLGPASSQEKLFTEVERTLEFAGVSGDIIGKVAATLKGNGGGSPATPVPEGQLAMSENALHILEQRYLRKDSDGNAVETPEDLFRRVSGAIAQGEQPAHRSAWADRFYALLTSLKFLPNSPTLVNAGTDRGCLSACFVVSPDDNMESIMAVAHDAAMIEKWGGGIGFGFSKLRPKNDKIRTTHGNACGPIAVMKLYSSVGATLTQGAFRLGAHMGQLRDSHPDVRDFIHCKDSDDTLQNFNISVQITDAFMQAVRDDAEWALINPRNEGDGPADNVVETVRARDLWDEIAESAHKTGDPGVVFMDRVWETAPNPQMGRIETSNPCGEEFLEDYGNCCLGSINLDRHVGADGFDWQALEDTVRTTVRFLDDVIEVNSFPLPKLREVNLATRRIGLGVMGFADALVRLGVPYDSKEALDLADELGGFIERIAWSESANLAVERGPFPEYEKSALKQRGLPPVRNSSVVTIAPTGTISRLAGCSSGIEPHFALAWWSNVLWKDQESGSSRLLDAPTSIWESLKAQIGDDADVRSMLQQIIENPEVAEDILAQHGLDPAIFRTSMTIDAEAHVRMQGVWQKHVTNSVSKTINMPYSATVDEVKAAFELAWETGCKAVTVYRDGSKSMQVLETGTEADSAPEPVSPGGMLVPRQRPKSVSGVTDLVRTGHGNMYVNINFDEAGNPFEVFTNMGKAGGCDHANLEAVSRLASLALRSGVDPDQIVEQLNGITCCPAWDGGTLIRSAPDAVAHALSNHIHGLQETSSLESSRSTAQLGLFPSTRPDESPANGTNGRQFTPTGARCPRCSGSLIPQEGCLKCLDCGFSKCD